MIPRLGPDFIPQCFILPVVPVIGRGFDTEQKPAAPGLMDDGVFFHYQGWLKSTEPLLFTPILAKLFIKCKTARTIACPFPPSGAPPARFALP